MMVLRIIEFPQVKYVYQENSGVSSARNRGIKHASYEWISFLDSDDTWEKEKLEKQVHFHKNNPLILMSYTDEKWIRNGIDIKIPKKFKKYGGDIFDKCLSHCIIAPSSTLIQKNLLETIGVFDESLEVCEDYDLWLRIALENEIGIIEEPLMTKYAGHDNQLSFKYWGMDRFRVISLEKFLNTQKKKEVLKMLKNKYKLLLKGAIKYDRIVDINEYEEKLITYE